MEKIEIDEQTSATVKTSAHYDADQQKIVVVTTIEIQKQGNATPESLTQKWEYFPVKAV